VPPTDLVKVIVRLESDEEAEHAWAKAESLWAQPVGENLLELRNIPWETDALHFLDIVRARQGDDGRWWALELVQPSGHSTIRLTFSQSASDDQRAELIHTLEQLVGRAEHMTTSHWAVDVNPQVDVSAALEHLTRSEREGIVTDFAHT
jgi:hypothetical protein